jgi:hypothetical protein
MGKDFLWKSSDGEERTFHVNNHTFSSVADLAEFDLPTTFDVVFIALPNLPLFDESLRLLSNYVTERTVVLVDVEMGIGLEPRVYRILPAVTCASICASDCDVKVTNPSEFEFGTKKFCTCLVSYSMVEDTNFDKSFDYFSMNETNLSTFGSILAESINICVATTRAQFVNAAWLKCLRIVALDVSAILYDKYDYIELVSQRNVNTAIQNLMEEVLVIADALGENEWCEEITKGDLMSIAEALAASEHHSFYTVAAGLESYILVMMFQLLLLSDDLGIRCPGIENTYAMLLVRFGGDQQTLFPSIIHANVSEVKVQNQLPSAEDATELEDLYFGAEEILMHCSEGPYEASEVGLERVSNRSNPYLDYDRSIATLTRTGSRRGSFHSSFEGMDTLENSKEFTIDPGPKNLRVPKQNHRKHTFGPTNNVKPVPKPGPKYPKRKTISSLLRSPQRSNIQSEPYLVEKHAQVMETMSLNGYRSTTTDRYGDVSNSISRPQG